MQVQNGWTPQVQRVEDASLTLSGDVKVIVQALDVFKEQFMRKLFALNRALPPGEDYVASLIELARVHANLEEEVPQVRKSQISDLKLIWGLQWILKTGKMDANTSFGGSTRYIV